MSIDLFVTLTFDLNIFRKKNAMSLERIHINYWRNQKFFKNLFLPDDVTKWRHNYKMFIYMEYTDQGLQYEVLLDMVLQLENFTLG